MAGVDTELLASVAELDPNIRRRVLRMAHRALDKAEYLMEHGDPKMQAVIIKEYLKVFRSHLENKKDNDEVERLRSALEELRLAVQTRMPGAIPVAMEDMNDAVIEAVVMDGPKIPTRIERHG